MPYALCPMLLASALAFYYFQLEDIALIKAMAAAGFVDVLFAEDNCLCICGQAISVGSEIAAMVADRMELGDIFGDGEELGHGAKRTATEIHIEACHYHPVTP